MNTPEAQSLRSDLIRFIVGLIHPTNELLCSDIIPRWAVIGWLITTCTSNIALANAKMALFYDWVCYDPKHDNIMNIGKLSAAVHANLRTGFLLQLLIVNIKTNLHVIKFVEDNINWT